MTENALFGYYFSIFYLSIMFALLTAVVMASMLLGCFVKWLFCEKKQMKTYSRIRNRVDPRNIIS